MRTPFLYISKEVSKDRNALFYIYGTHYGDKEGADMHVYRLQKKKQCKQEKFHGSRDTFSSTTWTLIESDAEKERERERERESEKYQINRKVE